MRECLQKVFMYRTVNIDRFPILGWALKALYKYSNYLLSPYIFSFIKRCNCWQELVLVLRLLSRLENITFKQFRFFENAYFCNSLSLYTLVHQGLIRLSQPNLLNLASQETVAGLISGRLSPWENRKVHIQKLYSLYSPRGKTSWNHDFPMD